MEQMNAKSVASHIGDKKIYTTKTSFSKLNISLSEEQLSIDIKGILNF